MGLYDTLNGEQIKCFPYVSIEKETGEIKTIYGNLDEYKTGDFVLHKSLWSLNYPKNFLILDAHFVHNRVLCPICKKPMPIPLIKETCDCGKEMKEEGISCSYCIHIIEDGFIKGTIYDLSLLDKIYPVYDYYGTKLNTLTKDDISSYVKKNYEYLKQRRNLLNNSTNQIAYLGDKLNEIYHQTIAPYIVPVNETYLQIGKYLDCIHYLYMTKSEKDYELFREKSKNFFKGKTRCFQKYKEYFDVPDDLFIEATNNLVDFLN